MLLRTSSAILILLILCITPATVFGQTEKSPSFSKTKYLVETKGKYKEQSAVVTFNKDELIIESKGVENRTFKYDEIVSAEYSYSKSPRWKTGLGLGAAGIAFPLIWLVAIPLGFTKHRRHWFTVRTKSQFAVLRLSKSERKLFIPTFETKSGVTVAAVGEDK